MTVKRHLMIGGEDYPARRYVPLHAPYSGQRLADVAWADEAETELAVGSAVQAAAVMRRLPAHRRADILGRLAAALAERREESAQLIATEAAKPIAAARAEVERTIQTYRFAAEEARRIRGETVPMDAAPGGEGRIGYTMREPLGVIGAITPFNFPMNLVAHKIGPAIAAGNAVVLKPAEQTPLSAYFIGELLREAGLPPGALNIVSGDGRIVGERLVQDPRVKMITFTGSPEVGIGIRSRAGLKRVTLELGSNAALIVDDGADVGAVAARCAVGAFSYQGQVCISLQRIYAVESVYDALVGSLVRETAAIKTGDPLDPAVGVSVLISGSATERALDLISEAVREGAVIAAGGTVSPDGAMLPTVLLNVPESAAICRKEAFAPVVVVRKVRSVDVAIELVNDSEFGLQAGIYTRDIGTALKAASALQAGGVIVNDIPTYRVDHMPYGGVKNSGIGREGVKYATEEMTEQKLVVFNRGEL